MTRAWLLAALAGVAGAACGGGSGASGPDAGGDAGLQRRACTVRTAREYVLPELGFLPGDQGLDLDGNGTVDNGLGALSDVFNQAMRTSAAAGAIYLLDFDGLAGAPPSGSVPTTMAFYVAQDADDPVNPSNDFAGAGSFDTYSTQLDVSCYPLSLASGTYQNQAATLTTAVFPVHVVGVATFLLEHMRTELTFSADLSRMSGTAGGVLSLCNLSHTYLAEIGSGTVLELLVNRWHSPPDFDGDGDGLERVMGDGQSGITGCVDADGTVIPGPGCACDPRIADGYTLALGLGGVPATIRDILDVGQ